jgi:hypothetical protein
MSERSSIPSLADVQRQWTEMAEAASKPWQEAAKAFAEPWRELAESFGARTDFQSVGSSASPKPSSTACEPVPRRCRRPWNRPSSR